MILELERIDKGARYTGGRLYLRTEYGKLYLCDTLEDTWRDLLGVIGKKESKVYGQTCIPEGEYEVRMDILSPKYSERIRRSKNHPLAFTGGYMPRLMGVPGYQGILIHTGNTPTDTLGCILVGTRAAGIIRGGTSTPAFRKVYEHLKNAYSNAERITIRITSEWTDIG